MIPMVFFVLGIVLEPCCYLYSRMIMQHAAAETLRVALTGEYLSHDELRAFCLRRLKAIPEVPLFHVGGESDWSIEVFGPGDDGEVSVDITGHARLLPIAQLVHGMYLPQDANGLILTTSVSAVMRPGWIEGDYDAWTADA